MPPVAVSNDESKFHDASVVRDAIEGVGVAVTAIGTVPLCEGVTVGDCVKLEEGVGGGVVVAVGDGDVVNVGVCNGVSETVGVCVGVVPDAAETVPLN